MWRTMPVVNSDRTWNDFVNSSLMFEGKNSSFINMLKNWGCYLSPSDIRYDQMTCEEFGFTNINFLNKPKQH